jgi:myosin heavy subunit
MAKIDTGKIAGYAEMSAEDKLKALEAFEYEDNATELERLKHANDKLSSESASWKKRYNDQLSEEEKKKQEDAENLAKMQKELEELRKDRTVSEYKAKFIAQGYSEALATDTAKALSDGDTAKVFVNQQKFLDEYAKQIKADALKGTPKPPAGQGGNGMTLKKLKSLPDDEYNKFAVEHPDEYKALYEKGE